MALELEGPTPPTLSLGLCLRSQLLQLGTSGRSLLDSCTLKIQDVGLGVMKGLIRV